MALSGIKTASEWCAEFTDQAVVRDAKVSQLECKTDEVRKTCRRLVSSLENFW